MSNFQEMFFGYFKPLPKYFAYEGNNYDLILKEDVPKIEDVLSLLIAEGFSYVYVKEIKGYFCQLPMIH
jgi:hypothetical protein